MVKPWRDTMQHLFLPWSSSTTTSSRLLLLLLHLHLLLLLLLLSLLEMINVRSRSIFLLIANRPNTSICTAASFKAWNDRVTNMMLGSLLLMIRLVLHRLMVVQIRDGAWVTQFGHHLSRGFSFLNQQSVLRFEILCWIVGGLCAHLSVTRVVPWLPCTRLNHLVVWSNLTGLDAYSVVTGVNFAISS